MHIHDSAPLSKHLAKPWHRGRHASTKALHTIAQSESKKPRVTPFPGYFSMQVPNEQFASDSDDQAVRWLVSLVSGICSCRQQFRTKSIESLSSLKAPASGLFRNIGSCCRCSLKNADCTEPKQSSQAFQEHSAGSKQRKAIFALSQMPVDLRSKSFP